MSRNRLLTILGPIASIAIICVALWFLHRELAGISFNAIVAQIKSVPIAALLASVGFAACSYLLLTGYDGAGLRYLGCQISYLHSALTSFMAFAVGHKAAFTTREVMHIRNYSLFVPRDFDISPYFSVVKPTIEEGFDYKQMTWSDDSPALA